MSTCQGGCRLARNAFATCPTHARTLRLYSMPPRIAIVRTMATCASQIPTMLEKTKTLVSQVLQPNSSGILSTESSEFWETILSTGYDDYQSRERPARLVVVGADSWSKSENLITALLSEPIASDEMLNDAIRDRLHNRLNQMPLNISYGQNVASEANSIQLPSRYLQQFTTAVQITEIAPSVEHNIQSMNDDDYMSLFKADFPVIVVNPVTMPIRDLFERRLPRHTIIALTTTQTSKKLHPLLASASASSRAILYIDPTRAVKALANLGANISSLSAIQRYQDDYIGSGVSSITEVLRGALAEPSNADFRTNSILAHLRGALGACQDVLRSEDADLRNALADVDSMSTHIEKVQKYVLSDIFGPSHVGHSRWGNVWPPIMRPRPVKEKVTEKVVAEALIQAQKQMTTEMDNLTWWRMLWRVDEISNLVNVAVGRTWCPDLERKLVMHAGRLASTQDDLAAQTFTMLAKYDAKSWFNSAVLYNSLQQKSTSQSYILSPSTLVEPLDKRKAQLDAFPTTQLHIRGQRAAVGMGTGVVASTSFGWLGWFGWLSGAGLSTGTDNALLHALSSVMNIGIEPSIAIGLGVFGALASVRWSIGVWEKAKRRWWEDWVRICDGLERDLKTTTENVLKERVTVIAQEGSDGLQQLVEQQKAGIAKFNDDLETLQVELENLERPCTEKRDN